MALISGAAAKCHEAARVPAPTGGVAEQGPGSGHRGSPGWLPSARQSRTAESATPRIWRNEPSQAAVHRAEAGNQAFKVIQRAAGRRNSLREPLTNGVQTAWTMAWAPAGGRRDRPEQGDRGGHCAAGSFRFRPEFDQPWQPPEPAGFPNLSKLFIHCELGVAASDRPWSVGAGFRGISWRDALRAALRLRMLGQGQIEGGGAASSSRGDCERRTDRTVAER